MGDSPAGSGGLRKKCCAGDEAAAGDAVRKKGGFPLFFDCAGAGGGAIVKISRKTVIRPKVFLLNRNSKKVHTVTFITRSASTTESGESKINMKCSSRGIYSL